MEDEDPKPEKPYPLSTAKMSKTPSWIMLGFLLGAAFVAALPPLRKKPAPPAEPTRTAEPARPTEPREPAQLTTIEAVFAEWGRHAVWSDDTTEVALWNSQDRAFTDFYEVRRYGGVFYFRTLSRLTRRIITRGKPLPDSPLQFTETEEQYREWVNYGRTERPAESRDFRPLPRNGSGSSVSRPSVDSASPALAPPAFEAVAPSGTPGPAAPAKK